MHFRGALLLVVTQDLARFELDVARVPATLVPVNSHQPRLASGGKGERRFSVVDRKIRIAIQNEKAAPQQRQRPFQSPTRAEQAWSVERVLDLQIKARAVAN